MREKSNEVNEERGAKIIKIDTPNGAIY